MGLLTPIDGVPKKKGDSFEVVPSKWIPIAVQAEELCQSHSWTYSEMAFVGGLHYDWLAALLNKQKAPKSASTALAAANKRGLVLAQIAVTMSLQMKEIKFQKHVFAGAHVLPLGTALMDLCFPNPEVNTEWTVPELTSLFVNSMGLLTPIDPAMRFSATPWMLAGENPDQRLLANLYCIAQRLADKRELEPVHLDWLKAQRLDVRTLQKKIGGFLG
jgi:hypothetical protein